MKKLCIIVFILSLTFQQATGRNNLNKGKEKVLYYPMDALIPEMVDFATSQFEYALRAVDSAFIKRSRKDQVIPRTINKDGSLKLVGPRDWCSGFFAGSLWFMYQFTEEDKWKQQADKFSKLIETEQFDETSHDVGFKIYNSFGKGYELTGDPYYKDVVIQSAKTLIKRFDKKIRSIRSWDWNAHVWQYPVIIDNMMNLELLFEATRLTGDSTFYKIATTHADTTLKNHFRDDYSSFHVVDYDTLSGHVRHKQTFQGYADTSAWARGQAWALYGFAMSYRYTKKPDYLKQAKGIVDFIFSNPHLPSDLIPYWDFDDPKIPDAPRDASAACITASALYELSGYSPENKEHYIAWADQILINLAKHYRAKRGTNQGFLLLHSTGHLPGKSEIDVPINYADYYFLESLLRRQKISCQVNLK